MHDQSVTTKANFVTCLESCNAEQHGKLEDSPYAEDSGPGYLLLDGLKPRVPIGCCNSTDALQNISIIICVNLIDERVDSEHEPRDDC